jgi:hypothetical protein
MKNIYQAFNYTIKQGDRTLAKKLEEKLEFTLYMWAPLPYVLSIGIISNLAFVIALQFVNRKGLKSPLRLIIILLTISDVMYLVNELNLWLFVQHRNFHITSIYGLCQVYSYLYYLFEVLNECHFILANFLILKLSRKRSQIKKVDLDLLETLTPIARTPPASPDLGQHQHTTTLHPSRSTAVFHTDQASHLIRKSLIKVNSRSTLTLSEYTVNIKKKALSLSAIKTSQVGSFDKVLKFNLNRFKTPVKYLEAYSSRTYDNYVLNERLFVVLYSFVFMYLISFMLWIQDVKTVNTFDLGKLKTYNICYTYKLARFFFNLFVFCLCFLRLISTFFNFALIAFYFTKLYFTYLWTRRLIWESGYDIRKYDRVFNKDIKTDTMVEFGFFDIIFVRYKFYLAGMINSLDSELKIKIEQIRKHVKHFKFVEFYIFSTLIYSICVVLNIISEFSSIVNSFCTNKLDGVSKLLKIYNFSHPLDRKQYKIGDMISAGFDSGLLLGPILDFQKIPRTTLAVNNQQTTSAFVFDFANVAHLLEIIGHCLKLFLFLLSYKYYICIFRRKVTKN